MSEIHRDRELEHLESMLYTYKVENKSMDTENERLKQEIRKLLAEKDKLLEEAEYEFRLMAENDKLRAALEEIDNELNTAAQDDCENGVKWLNERAAEGYLKEYPCTLAAISKVLRVTRAALGDEND